MNASLSSLARRSAWSTHASKAKSCKKCLCQFNQNSCVSCKEQSWQSGSLLWKRHHIEEWHHLCDGAAKVTGYLLDRASLCAQSFLGGQSEPLKSMEIRGPFEACSPSRLPDLKVFLLRFLRHSPLPKKWSSQQLGLQAWTFCGDVKSHKKEERATPTSVILQNVAECCWMFQKLMSSQQITQSDRNDFPKPGKLSDLT